MFTNAEEHAQFLKYFAEKAFEAYLNNKDKFLSWELFWSQHIELKYIDFFAEIFKQKLEEPTRTDLDAMLPFMILTDEHRQVFESIKQELNIKYQIKSVTYDQMMPKIQSFFKTHKNIDFTELSTTEQNKLLVDEDIMLSSPSIFECLGLSHMQYKYLYQRGSVLV